MSAFKVSAKFRMKNGAPFAIETISGIQFRCGVCGKIFFSRKEIESHLIKEKSGENFFSAFPEMNWNITVSAIYTQDIRDVTNSKYPRLSKGDRLLRISGNGKENRKK